MSKLDDMIKRLCPDGVEFMKLGEVCLKTNKVKWSETSSDFKYIDLTSVDRKTHSIKDCDIINKDNAPSRAQQVVHTDDVIFGTTRPTLMRICNITRKHDGQICSTGFCVIRPNKMIVLPHFLYHILLTDMYARFVKNHQKGANYPSISDKDIFRFEIPLPPLEIQAEIVRILDKFTQLEAELEAELDCRKRQYEFYRDQLLNFDKLTPPERSNVVWNKLEEISKISSGKNKVKNKEGAYPVYGSTGIIAHSDSFKYDNDQILIARVGANAGFVHLASGMYDVSDNTLIVDLKKSISIKYVYYILDNLKLNKYAQGGGQPLVTASRIKKVEIPIPPLTEQNRIVAILDRFEVLTTPLQHGLPAEIAARRQQYEYYRDKLLDFKRKTA